MAGKSLRPCLAGLPLASALLKEPELFWAPSSFLEEREKQLLVVPNRLFIEAMKSPTPLWHADSHLCIKSTRECQL